MIKPATWVSAIIIYILFLGLADVKMTGTVDGIDGEYVVKLTNIFDLWNAKKA